MSDRRRPRLARVTSAAALVAAGLLLIGVPPATAAGASVSVVNEQGTATVDPDFATAVTVRGTGFQAIQGGFGGVYVLFGWVDPSSWRPSAGGVVGADFRYVPDQESRDNAGFQRFVAFAGSDTESSANAVMGADGSWSTTMNIPGAVFESQDRTGTVSEVDCRRVQCGVITIGAHGVKNANNETFTPVSFASPAASGGAAVSTAEETAETDGAPAAGSGAGAARVGYSGESAVAGNVLSFTAQGFDAGEQVIATLDDGVAAVGPLIAGAAGEVAGVLQLPSDLRPGTHLLTVSGAASGISAETEVTVAADPNAVPAAAASTAEPAWPYLLLGIAILFALVALITGLVTSAVRRRRLRKARKAAAAADAAAADAATAGVAPAEAASGSGAPRASDTVPRWSSPADRTGSDPAAETVKLETVR